MKWEPAASTASHSGVLAVLFFRAILRHDEFRLERHNLVVTGSDQGSPSMAWKYSLPALPRSRVEQFGQWMALEQKYSVPSRAIGTWSPRRRKLAKPPALRSSAASVSANTGSSRAGAAGSSMSRM